MDERERPLSAMRTALAALCHYCPVCSYGRRRPESLLGRLLHHPLHSDHCPFWNAEKEAYPPASPESAR